MTADWDKQPRILTPAGDGAAVYRPARLVQDGGAGGLAHPALVQRFQLA
jgi:hypothetical protein